MSYFHLEKPPEIEKSRLAEILIFEKQSKHKELYQLVQRANTPEYLYWDKVKYFPITKELHLSQAEFWMFVKNTRFNYFGRKKSLIRREKGESFTWTENHGYQELFHEIDLN